MLFIWGYSRTFRCCRLGLLGGSAGRVLHTKKSGRNHDDGFHGERFATGIEGGLEIGFWLRDSVSLGQKDQL